MARTTRTTRTRTPLAEWADNMCAEAEAAYPGLTHLLRTNALGRGWARKRESTARRNDKRRDTWEQNGRFVAYDAATTATGKLLASTYLGEHASQASINDLARRLTYRANREARLHIKHAQRER